MMEMSCPNAECDLHEVEVFRPSMLVIAPGVTIRPVHVCPNCEWELRRLPDRPLRPKLTWEEGALVVEAVQGLLARTVGADQDDVERRVRLEMILERMADCRNDA